MRKNPYNPTTSLWFPYSFSMFLFNKGWEPLNTAFEKGQEAPKKALKRIGSPENCPTVPYGFPTFSLCEKDMNPLKKDRKPQDGPKKGQTLPEIAMHTMRLEDPQGLPTTTPLKQKQDIPIERPFLGRISGIFDREMLSFQKALFSQGQQHF